MDIGRQIVPCLDDSRQVSFLSHAYPTWIGGRLTLPAMSAATGRLVGCGLRASRCSSISIPSSMQVPSYRMALRGCWECAETSRTIGATRSTCRSTRIVNTYLLDHASALYDSYTLDPRAILRTPAPEPNRATARDAAPRTPHSQPPRSGPGRLRCPTSDRRNNSGV